MKFEEAMALLREGKMVKRLTGPSPRVYRLCDGDYRYAFDRESILADDWEEHIELHDLAWALERLKEGYVVQHHFMFGRITPEDAAGNFWELMPGQDGKQR